MNKFNDKLVLIPDSGFRLFFFPLQDPKTIADPEIKEIARLNRNLSSKDSSGNVPGYSDEWSTAHTLYHQNSWNVVNSPTVQKYIRYKFGVCHHGAVDYEGLWLAVETNVGDVDRGWQYQEAPTSRAAEDYFNSNGHPGVPYHATNLSSMAGDVTVPVNILDRSIEVNIRWSSVLTATPLDVDLVIDFGNSRTAVLVLEYKAGAGSGVQFAQHCRPLSLKPSFYSILSRQAYVDDAIVSSRFVIKTPEFRMFDPDSKDNALILHKFKTKKVEKGFLDKLLKKDTQEKLDKVEQRVPHMFSKISPVCLGDDMEELIHGQTPLGIEANRRMQGGEQMQQSSAKRYFWDNDLSQQAWSCVPNYGEKVFGEPGRISLLSGLMLRFQPEDGKIWGEDSVLPSDWPLHSRPIINPTGPRYPRRNTLTWSVLSIIETAYRQINDSKWTQQAGVFNKRIIRNVIATYPSGWTSTEISQYRAKWLEAIRIFQATNLRSGEPAIQLDMRIDEAVASQLPLIYASIDRLSSHVAGENWISINGKNTEGEELPKLRVMNIDIGGGTSDVSVVEYQDKKAGLDIDLDASVLFKDSSTVAGDLLVKSIINKIILPKLLPDDPDRYLPIARKFFANNQNIDVTSKRVSILTGTLLPLAIYLLKERCSGRWNEGALKFNAADAGVTSNRGFYDIIYGPGTNVDLKRPMYVDVSELDQQVEELFGKLIRSLAKYAEIFDVDMLMVCGKPSEQPAIKSLIQRMLPIASERILFTHGFKAGAWYPFKQGEDSEISDAKSVTCVGAALERAMTLKIIPGWKINFKNNSGYRNNWGVMPASGPRFSSDILSASNDESSELILNNRTRIGRKMFAVNSCFPEPVYRLDIGDNIASAKVVFKRLSGDGSQGSESSDALEIVSAVDPVTGDDLSGQIYLKLYPVGKDSLHWTDTGKLD